MSGNVAGNAITSMNDLMHESVRDEVTSGSDTKNARIKDSKLSCHLPERESQSLLWTRVTTHI